MLHFKTKPDYTNTRISAHSNDDQLWDSHAHKLFIETLFRSSQLRDSMNDINYYLISCFGATEALSVIMTSR